MTANNIDDEVFPQLIACGDHFFDYPKFVADGSIAHFVLPAVGNKCALLCSLSAFFVIYLTADQLDMYTLCTQFPQVTSVFNQFICGAIDNVDATTQLMALFQIVDLRWTNNQPVSTDLPLSYLKSELSTRGINGMNAFDWSYRVSWQCTTCNTVEVHSTRTNSEIAFTPRMVNESIDESIRMVQHEPLRRRQKCSGCDQDKEIVSTTETYPTILTLVYPTAEGNGPLDLPPYLAPHLQLDGVTYALRGATYGDGNHFIFRYYVNGKVFECDNHDGFSVEIPEPFEEAFAGHLIGGGTGTEASARSFRGKIVDVFYYKQK